MYDSARMTEMVPMANGLTYMFAADANGEWRRHRALVGYVWV